MMNVVWLFNNKMFLLAGMEFMFVIVFEDFNTNLQIFLEEDDLNLKWMLKNLFEIF